jgi:NADH-quinone oxidoreductase subunit F
VNTGHVVLRHREVADLHRLDVYQSGGGWEQFRRAVTTMQPSEVIDVVKASGLRGRGGAGFPTGVKWSFCPPEVFPKYVVVNNDESEPGTFKDREITERNPHQLLEGTAIACYAIGARTAYIYSRGEFRTQMRDLEAAIADARSAGMLGSGLFGTDYGLEIHTVSGAGAYICGEETALLNSLEGELGHPRLKPPFPAASGLFGQPTVINNTETLANVPPILAAGADAWRRRGTEKSPGTKVFCVSGHVERPGNYELDLGTPFEVLLDAAGGVGGGRRLKGVLPAGASAPMLPAAKLEGLALDWESVAAAGSILGSASFIVLDETVDTTWVAAMTTRFFKHESCGKCSPCREGTYWMNQLYGRIRSGKASPDDVATLDALLVAINGKCFCPLGEFALSVPRSTMALFPGDYAAAVSGTAPGAPGAGVDR